MKKPAIAGLFPFGTPSATKMRFRNAPSFPRKLPALRAEVMAAAFKERHCFLLLRFSSAQVSYPSLPPVGESSLTPLRLLFPPNPLALGFGGNPTPCETGLFAGQRGFGVFPRPPPENRTQRLTGGTGVQPLPMTRSGRSAGIPRYSVPPVSRPSHCKGRYETRHPESSC